MVTVETLFLPIAELGHGLRSGAFTSSGLTQAYLERCRTVGARLNAFVTLTPDLALQQAHQADL